MLGAVDFLSLLLFNASLKHDRVFNDFLGFVMLSCYGRLYDIKKIKKRQNVIWRVGLKSSQRVGRTRSGSRYMEMVFTLTGSGTGSHLLITITIYFPTGETRLLGLQTHRRFRFISLLFSSQKNFIQARQSRKWLMLKKKCISYWLHGIRRQNKNVMHWSEKNC